jgi:hypothetical protein
LFVALLVVMVAAGSGSSSSLSKREAVRLVAWPAAQSLETRVIERSDPRTHRRTAVLRLGTARFRITVSNTGRVRLAGVVVRDASSPRCGRSIGTLAPGAVVRYVCVARSVGRDYVNTARVFARAQAGPARAIAAAGRAVVHVKKPQRRVHAHKIAFSPAPRPPKRVHAHSLPFTG